MCQLNVIVFVRVYMRACVRAVVSACERTCVCVFICAQEFTRALILFHSYKVHHLSLRMVNYVRHFVLETSLN